MLLGFVYESAPWTHVAPSFWTASCVHVTGYLAMNNSMEFNVIYMSIKLMLIVSPQFQHLKAKTFVVD